MTQPTITIKGQQLKLPPLKADTWLEILKLKNQKIDLNKDGALEPYISVIAHAFNLPLEEVLPNLKAADILPKYFALAKWGVITVSDKLRKAARNGYEDTEEDETSDEIGEVGTV